MKTIHVQSLFLIAVVLWLTPQSASAAHDSLAEIHHYHQVQRAELKADYDQQRRELEHEFRCEIDELRQQRHYAARAFGPAQAAMMYRISAQERSLKEDFRCSRARLKRQFQVAMRRLDAHHRLAVQSFRPSRNLPCGCESQCECDRGPALNGPALNGPLTNPFAAQGNRYIDGHARQAIPSSSAAGGFPGSDWQRMFAKWMNQSPTFFPFR